MLVNSFYVTFLSTYLLSSISCFLVDTLVDYRINQKSRLEILNDYKIIIPNVSFNIFLGYFVIEYIEHLHNSKLYESYFDSFIVNLFIWLLTCDFIFYFVHRALHHPKLFYLHKTHHEFEYTYGAGAIYSHPFEFVFGNIFPLSFPLIYFSIPKNQCLLLIFLSTFYTVVISHGGYKINRSHLDHHLKKMGNYGLLITDRIFSTVL